ncbi:MAG TPA: GNAT family protein [Flavipsychrobacter sp.]|nr:GNAT family protein [Flavipsychrobacter sp.]
MELHTARLNIRDLTFADLDDIHDLHSRPESDEYNTLGIPETIDITRHILNEWITAQNDDPRISYIFAVELIESHQFIGLISLIRSTLKYNSAEIWYKIHPDYWKKGYATEAIRELLHFGFNKLHLHRIDAGCVIENIASIKVLEKIGMTREGSKRMAIPIRGTWRDSYEYSILEEEYEVIHKQWLRKTS